MSRCAVCGVWYAKNSVCRLETAPCIQVSKTSVCTRNTSTCGENMWTCCQYTQRDVFESTHGGWGSTKLTCVESSVRNLSGPHMWVCSQDRGIYTFTYNKNIMLHLPPDTYTSTNTNQSQDQVRLKEDITKQIDSITFSEHRFYHCENVKGPSFPHHHHQTPPHTTHRHMWTAGYLKAHPAAPRQPPVHGLKKHFPPPKKRRNEQMSRMLSSNLPRWFTNKNRASVLP